MAREVTDPSLGMFSWLPKEARIMIWKQFTPRLHLAGSLPRKPDHLSRDQDILLTSRKIYEEVATEVPTGFNGDKIYIYVSAEYQHERWIKVRGSEEQGAKWYFKNAQDAISRGFLDLPWDKMKVRIHILAPDRTDSGQLICLYHNVRFLVDLLKKATGFLSLKVVFVPTENTSWLDDARGRPQRSINQSLVSGWGRPRREIKWDHDFIYPLFLHLRNAKKAKIWIEEMEGKRENPLMVSALEHAQSVMEKPSSHKSQAEPNEDDRQIDIRLDLLLLMVECVLDVLQSRTADMLRLARFSSWYTDKLYGDSPYEADIVRALTGGARRVPRRAQRDRLSSCNSRCRLMRALNPLSLAHQSAFPETLESIEHLDRIGAKDWNRDAWHCVYKNGIPPLDSFEIGQMYRKWTMEDDHPENGRQFKKLHRYFSLLLNPRCGFFE